MGNDWPLFLAVSVAGIGVGGQNIGAAILGLYFLVAAARRRLNHRNIDQKDGDQRVEIQPFRFDQFSYMPLVAGVVLLAAVTLSTLTNQMTPNIRLNFLGGYAYWLLAPNFFSRYVPALSEKSLQRIGVAGVIALTVIALVSASQFLWGWKLLAGEFVAAEPRGRGFFSHPLSLAYAAIIWFPFSLVSLFVFPRRKLAWIAAIAVGSIIITTASRTVQAVAVVLVAWNVYSATRGRLRMGLLLLIATGMMSVALSDNSVSRKFRNTINGVEDRQSHFADDRLAFWQVHWNMFKEKPLIGHGDGTDTPYRSKYYEIAGLGGLTKKYEAHNMYLQIMVNAGTVGLVAFLFWWWWNLRLAFSIRSHSIGRASLQAMVALLASGVTQNAFQDSAVRFNLTTTIAVLWIVAQSVRARSETNAPGR